jgi:Flp pilus assembly protein TadG
MARDQARISFLTRLGRDIRGNTVALAAAAMLPLAGLIGGGVDMSRLYLTKTRLQHACDAGALAGRKAMGAGSWTTSGTGSSQSRANELFSANFLSGAYGTSEVTKNFSESNGTVTGTATVTVPMTIMRVFGATERSLTVNCTAKMEIPNTDVMFVLDVTGSMNCVAGDTSCSNNGGVPASGSKIDGIKSAVKCFYEALVKVNTPEVCGSDPSSTSYTQNAQIRMGFVPYSVNVNVGKLLPHDAIADSWFYQSRKANFHEENVYTAGATTVNGPYWESYSSSISQSECLDFMKNRDFDGWGGFSPTPTTSGSLSSGSQTTTSFPNDSSASAGGTDGEWGWSGASDTSGDYRSCRRLRTDSTTTYSVTGTVQVFDDWTYKRLSHNVSGLKGSGTSWNNSVTLPLGSSGTNTSVTWDGCIEERATVQNSDTTPGDEWSPIPAAAFDMDIDKLPDPSVTGTQWGPMLNGAVWARYTGSGRYASNTTSDVTTSSDLSRNDYYVCPTEAKKLQTWYTSGNFVTYVNSLKADGNTYHDIGMIWGARFISPTGIFASQNAATSTGGAIQRHIIFMTDGDTNSQNDDYNAYGVPWWDRRQTTYAPSSTNLGNIINARLSALCTAIKNKNITLWVISYGGGINATTETRLKNCATSGKYFSAANTTTLISNFKQIASEIAELRLTN